MALPPAVKKVRVTFGSGATQVTGSNVSTEVSFTPTAAVIWAATGVPLLNPTEVVTSEPGEEAVAEIVNPNQPGFIDGNGNTVRDYGVRVVVRYLVNKTAIGSPLTKLVKFAEDDEEVDLDLMIPVTSASGTVVYIPDSWSADVVAAQQAAIDALAAAELAAAVGATDARVAEILDTEGGAARTIVNEQIEAVTAEKVTLPAGGAAGQALVRGTEGGVEWGATPGGTIPGDGALLTSPTQVTSPTLVTSENSDISLADRVLDLSALVAMQGSLIATLEAEIASFSPYLPYDATFTSPYLLASPTLTTIGL
jgi:hypothetical protein